MRSDATRNSPPPARELVLVGGGHSHALALRMLGMNPLRGVRVTLVSDVSHAPYSGMLPGHIAGTYTWDEAHIDLRRLCRFAGVGFVLGNVTGLDLANRRVLVEGRGPLAFDVVSLNTGSTPAPESARGVAEHALRAKPVPAFLAAWEETLRAFADPATRPVISIVGGGAGGVELALAVDKHLAGRAHIRVLHRDSEILTTHNPAVRRKFAALLASRGVEVRTGFEVAEVTADGLVSTSGEQLASDRVFWVTNAAPHPWIAASGLAVNAQGFALVSNTLQSTSHPFVFAAGDNATLDGDPRPKSGVFAVRMAKPLLANLRRFLHGKPLRAYHPQRDFLSLIGASDGTAVASRKGIAWHSPLMWKLKDHIDRKFMRKFEDLPAMGEEAQPAPDTPDDDSLVCQLDTLQRDSAMRCLGCAAKVGGPVLSRALRRLRDDIPEAAASLAMLDDAAELEIPPGARLIQTVDYMPALVDDPWLFGRIVALHSFSDIFAMGGRAHSAVAAVLLPFAAPPLMEESLYQTLAGLVEEMRKMGALLVGGHTAEGNVLGVALTCNGLLETTTLRKQGLKIGDALILTKPIGTGVLFAAEMRLKTRGAWIDTALESMLASNEGPAQILAAHGATACTDVTGFGLAGHLGEMLAGTGLASSLRLAAVPVLPGAAEAVAQGIASSLNPQNREAASSIANTGAFRDDPRHALLFDPQTSGGLLAGVPSENAETSLHALHEAGHTASTIIGKVIARDSETGARIVLG